MVRGIDPALLMFAGRFLSQGGGNPGNGFGNALGAGLEAAGGVQLYRQEQQRQKQQDLVKAAETSINMRRAMQEIQINEDNRRIEQQNRAAKQAALEQQQAAQQAYIQQLPLDQQALAMANFGEFSKQQAQAEARSPYKVVGRDLVDVEAEGGPQTVFTGQPNPTVSISNKAESARDVGLAKLAVSRVEKGYAQAESAKRQLSMVDTLSSLNDAAFAGKLANAQLFGSQLAASLGVNIEGLSETEQFNAISNQLALQIRNPDSGGGLTGSTSQRDLDFLIASIPNITQSRGGRERLIGALRAGLNRNVRIADARAQYLETNGNLKGFEDFVQSNFPPTPNLTQIAGLSGDPELDGRMSSLGVSFEDVNYTAQVEGLAVNEVLDLLEQRNAP